MTSWLEQIRQKKLPDGREPSVKSAKSHTPDHSKNLVNGRSPSAKSARSSTLGTFGTAPSTTSEVLSMATPSPVSEVIIVAYQPFWIDYDLPDGSYTPKELKRARKIVMPGIVLRYRLRWPGGATHPPAAVGRYPSVSNRKGGAQCETCGGKDLDRMNGHTVCMTCLKRRAG